MWQYHQDSGMAEIQMSVNLFSAERNNTILQIV